MLLSDVGKPIPYVGALSGSIPDKKGVAEEDPLLAWPRALSVFPLAKLTFPVVLSELLISLGTPE